MLNDTGLRGEITNEKLDKLGFSTFNKHFTHRCFPAPLYGNWRIDYRTPKNDPNVIPTNCWVITFTNGFGEACLKYPKNMDEVNSFYHGICDKSLF